MRDPVSPRRAAERVLVSERSAPLRVAAKRTGTEIPWNGSDNRVFGHPLQKVRISGGERFGIPRAFHYTSHGAEFHFRQKFHQETEENEWLVHPPASFNP